MNFLAFAGLLNLISSIGLGLFVYFQNPSKRINQAYGLFNLTIGLYSFGYFMWQMADSSVVAKIWFDILFIGIILINIAYLYFVFIFLDILETKKKVLAVAGAINIFFFVMTLMGKVYTGVEPRWGLGYWPRPTNIFHFYLVFWHWSCTYGFWCLIRELKKAKGLRREQIKYVILACGLGYLGGATNWPMWYGIRFPPYMNIGVSLYVALIAYAILRPRLLKFPVAVPVNERETFFPILDAKLSIRDLTIYAALPCVVLLICLVLIVVEGSLVLVGSVLVLFLLIEPLLFDLLRDKIISSVNYLPLFQGKFVSFQETEKKIQSFENMETVSQWSRQTLEIFRSIFPARRVSVLVRDSEKPWLRINSAYGLDAAESVFTFLDLKDPMAQWCQNTGSILLKDSVRSCLPAEDHEATFKLLEILHAVIVVPVFFRGAVFAVILLDEKKNGDIYNDLDLASMGSLTRGAEHALHSILAGMSKEQLSAEWAHDILKPFTEKGSFQVLEEILEGRRWDVPSDLKSSLKLMAEDVKFARKNLMRLLDPDQKDKYSVGSASFTEMLTRVRERYSRQMEKKGLVWNVDVPPDHVRVLCDLMMIEHRVLANLVENAIRYTPEHGRIEVGWRIEGDRFVTTVKDTGRGMAEEDVGKLFQRGKQLNNGEKGVAGLGLYIAKSVLEGQGGKIYAESRLGQGTTFTFELPLAARG